MKQNIYCYCNIYFIAALVCNLFQYIIYFYFIALKLHRGNTVTAVTPNSIIM